MKAHLLGAAASSQVNWNPPQSTFRRIRLDSVPPKTVDSIKRIVASVENEASRLGHHLKVDIKTGGWMMKNMTFSISAEAPGLANIVVKSLQDVVLHLRAKGSDIRMSD